ncbi:MAG: alkaline phosphatase [Gammaproteobacteria bacterium]
MKRICQLITLCAGWAISVATPADSSSEWFKAGQHKIIEAKRLFANRKTAKNIILFVGDGLGVSTVTAARILEGQQRNASGEENFLSFERFPYLALSKTYNTDQQIPDSAGTMTAIMTGVKTRAGMLSISENSRRGECRGTETNILPTLLEEFETLGKSTGIVTTARLTHATPAATYAHVSERQWEDDSGLSKKASGEGCHDIARQLIEFPFGDGLDVALGGGRRHFLPQVEREKKGQAGRRKDNRDLTKEWLKNYRQSAYVWNKKQLAAIKPESTGHLLGLFNPSHMQYESDREENGSGEPSLTEMTKKSIQILGKNPKGYFLMVEAGRIDHGHHANNAFRALTETIELSKAVKVARDLTDRQDTLIIVTADHSHALSIAGYPTRGNPILGKVVENKRNGDPSSKPALDANGHAYATLSYTNGRGFATLDRGGDTRYTSEIKAGRVTYLDKVNTRDEGFHQEALIPLNAATHSGEDVAIYADGPGAYLLSGVIEQNVIYHAMKEAAGMNKQ